MTYRYYLTMRPPMLGTIPMRPRPVKVEDWDFRRDTGHGFPAWGFVEYDEPLPEEVADAYELRTA